MRLSLLKLADHLEINQSIRRRIAEGCAVEPGPLSPEDLPDHPMLGTILFSHQNALKEMFDGRTWWRRYFPIMFTTGWRLVRLALYRMGCGAGPEIR